MATLSDLQKRAHDNARAKGWWADWDRNIPEQISLMHSELSEALEEHRAGRKPNERYKSRIGSIYVEPHPLAGQAVPLKPEGIPSELADVIIRIFDFCGRYGIDLEDVILEKMAFNETRPARHGGKVC